MTDDEDDAGAGDSLDLAAGDLSDAAGPDGSDLDPRVRETLRRVYDVEGVIAAKVWSMPERMFVGVRVAHGHGLDRVLMRVHRATQELAEPGEQWEFGVLDSEG